MVSNKEKSIVYEYFIYCVTIASRYYTFWHLTSHAKDIVTAVHPNVIVIVFESYSKQRVTCISHVKSFHKNKG